MTALVDLEKTFPELTADLLAELWADWPSWQRDTYASRTGFERHVYDVTRESVTLEWCEDCSAPMLDTDTMSVPNGYVCASCYEDYLGCSDCGDETRADDMTETVDGSVCERCADHNYRTCEDCGAVVRRHDSTDVGNGSVYRWVCDSCRDDWYHCDDCSEWYHSDDYSDHDHSGGCDCEAPYKFFSLRNDGAAPVDNDQRVTITLPAGVIDGQGIKSITRHLRNAGIWADDVIGGLEPVWVAKRGTYTRRLSSAVYRTHGTKIPADVLSEVGNIAQAHTTRESEYHIEFTRELNMSADAFGHSDSCYWQSYYESRCALKYNGGIGLRSFSRADDYAGYVTGRVWVMPLAQDSDGVLFPTSDTDASAFVVFNGYGDLGGYVPARILAQMQGMTYRKIEFAGDPMYINAGGYLVAPEDITSKTSALSFSLDCH